jgi:hypothetical protein
MHNQRADMALVLRRLQTHFPTLLQSAMREELERLGWDVRAVSVITLQYVATQCAAMLMNINKAVPTFRRWAEEGKKRYRRFAYREGEG